MYELIDFSVKGDYQGSLVPIEGGRDIPFQITRVYYIYRTQKNVVRGKHAHKNLEQVIICLSGSCDFLLDDGFHKEHVHLNSPNRGLYIKHNIWREFTNFSEDCVILVLASEHYKEEDYIRNYEDFVAHREILQNDSNKEI